MEMKCEKKNISLEWKMCVKNNIKILNDKDYESIFINGWWEKCVRNKCLNKHNKRQRSEQDEETARVEKKKKK